MKNLHKILGWVILSILSGGWMQYGNAKTDHVIFLADPRITAISIVDNQEPMIDLKNQHILLYGPSPEVPNNTDYTKMRKTIYDKLIQAQALLPKGLRFCLYEGYRSLDLQNMLFTNRFKKIKKLNPDWPGEKIFIETTRLVSPVVNQDGSHNIPPHSTGGVIDIYLVDVEGRYVDMGIHPKDWMQDNDGSISLTASKTISPEAQKNREIMSGALSSVGFVNYPAEYWHWSYGDRYWAYYKKQPHAIYNSYQG